MGRSVYFNDITPAPGNEYVASAYPGTGAYRINGGSYNGALVFVNNGSITLVQTVNVPPLTDAPEGAMTVNVHHFMDQIIRLMGK